ncbi:MAG TPA: cytochrome c oxidase subunit II [Steroidobacteraceae bacterium]|jgi:cytochrome c oxidase subunit 2
MSKCLKYVAAAIAACLPASAALAAWEVNMTTGVTELSRDIHGLHMLIFWICVLIAIAVFGMIIYSLVKFRYSQGAVPAKFDHSTKAEIIWTIIPIAILVGMAIPAAETLIKIEDTRDSQLTIKVTGYQWKWHYDYLDQKVNFFSTLARDSDQARQLHSGIDPKTVPNYLLAVDHPLVVPVGKKVRVLLTAGDVIHAWWVPAFGMKKDAIPGFVNELWFRADETGTFRGQCAELCGRDHGFMPIVVEVKTQAEYDTWLKAQQEATKQASQPEAPAPAAAPAATAKIDEVATAIVAKAE